jgi:hypothetical protein
VESALELLDRQYERVKAADGATFLQELKRYRDLVESDKRLSPLVEHISAETEAAHQAFKADDDELVKELVALKTDLVARASDLDDSGEPRPADDSMRLTNFGWQRTFANFDQVASHGVDAMYERRDWDDSRSGLLVAIVTEKLHAAQWHENKGPVLRIAETSRVRRRPG